MANLTLPINHVADPYAGARRPLVFAHRGASHEAPENTLPAFTLAVEMGADALETDVHRTKDGVIVVAHDDDVSRMTNGVGIIEEQTYAQLLELDFGYHFTADGGKSYPYRGTGVKLMRFSDLLNTFPHIRVNVDLKPKNPTWVDQYIREVYEAGAEDRVMTASFHHAVLKELRVRNRRLATSASPREVATMLIGQRTGLPLSRSLPYQALQVPPSMYGIRVVTEGLVKAAHRRGAQVHVWTVDEKEEMERLLNIGVDGIVSNNPRLARAVIEDYR